jgi:hypothetical protein
MAPREHRRRTPRCLQMILKHLRGLRQLEARAFKKAEAPGGVARGFLRKELVSQICQNETESKEFKVGLSLSIHSTKK